MEGEMKEAKRVILEILFIWGFSISVGVLVGFLMWR
jgi:hypothetical protein